MVVTVREHGKCNEKQQSATRMTAKPETSLLLTALKALYNLCIFHKADYSTSKAAAQSCTLCPVDQRSFENNNAWYGRREPGCALQKYKVGTSLLSSI